MPDLRNLTEAEASPPLVQAGLTSGRRPRRSTRVPVGSVVEPDPRAGTRSPRGPRRLRRVEGPGAHADPEPDADPDPDADARRPTPTPTPTRTKPRLPLRDPGRRDRRARGRRLHARHGHAAAGRVHAGRRLDRGRAGPAPGPEAGPRQPDRPRGLRPGVVPSRPARRRDRGARTSRRGRPRPRSSSASVVARAGGSASAPRRSRTAGESGVDARRPPLGHRAPSGPQHARISSPGSGCRRRSSPQKPDAGDHGAAEVGGRSRSWWWSDGRPSSGRSRPGGSRNAGNATSAWADGSRCDAVGPLSRRASSADRGRAAPLATRGDSGYADGDDVWVGRVAELLSCGRGRSPMPGPCSRPRGSSS